MILFFLKKSFYSGWDNMFHILAINVLIVAIGVGGFCGASLLAGNIPLSVGTLILAAMAEGVIFMALSRGMAKVAAYKAFTFRDFLSAIKDVWLHGALWALVAAAAVIVIAIAVPYYLRLGTALGLGLAMILVWFAVVFALAFQWFLPIRSQLEANFLKCLRKCFIIFFDNAGFSVFMFFYSLALMVLSLLMILLMPGFAGLILAQNEAFRLRLYKYDWLESHPELDFRTARKAVPWSELIAGDYETVGHRSLKSFIFPWKD